MKPSVGRIVHFHTSNGPAAAIVINVHSELEVDLQVFHADGSIKWVTDVPAGVAVGCWDWPPRV
ncbi:hypothetical protein DUZ99_02240 [Xylanibacillus composti]|uniref:Uncharacterized protein n=1 Tax=Xylanibacillus composti TaxID=1572762 RepID=A0A8J4M019_9BACL|nr:hypothetical protein [Xylanibacillus composti]MDT9723815.1 hypothetical protein [Xylanibacillus composti]GIQ67410.1 hypothetical protein XYCOK13_02340 [Xylanibacillus composti]